jgi:type IV secretory pathway TrbD component
MEIDEPEGYRIPIHQALVRPRLLLGAERMLVIYAAAIPACTFASGDFRIVLGVGLPMWLLALIGLRYAAKIDTQLSDTLPRSFDHRHITSAQPTLRAIAPPRKVHQ